jgi:hypothetical protein
LTWPIKGNRPVNYSSFGGSCFGIQAACLPCRRQENRQAGFKENYSGKMSICLGTGAIDGVGEVADQKGDEGPDVVVGAAKE